MPEGYFGILRDVTTTDVTYSVSSISSSGWDQSSEPSEGTVWTTNVYYDSNTTITVQTEASLVGSHDWESYGSATITESHIDDAYVRTIIRVWEE